ncbi:MAG: J domain-containing protein [Nitrospirae bacterium]|nr:J domain-containing protein [Nitrospirota bacterium]
MNELELYDACRVLFGKEVRIDRQFLEYIQPSGVKSAYRKMALATHPDRIAAMGPENQAAAGGDFRVVADAYEKLTKYLKLREGGFRFKTNYSTYGESTQRRDYSAKTWQNAPQKTAQSAAKDSSSSSSAWKTNSYYGGSTWQDTQQKETSASNYSGNYGYTQKASYATIDSQKTSTYSYQQKAMPKRKLRIGEYLYYSGVVAWKDLIASIVWQTKQRQRIGEIATRWGWLNEGKILDIMKSRNRGERLGDALVRLKIITPFQCNMLVWQQQKSQNPLGKYFTAEQLISESDLNRHLTNLKSHNQNIDKPTSSG